MRNTILALFSVLIITSCSTESKTITQMVTFTVKPAYIEEFREAQVNSLNHSLQEEGNLEMKLYGNDNNPYKFYVYSKWKDEKAYKLHRDMPYSKSLGPLFQKALQGAPQIIKLEDTKLGHINSKELISKGNEQAVFISFKVKEEYRERIIKQFEKHTINSRKEEGNVFYDFYTIKGEKNMFYVYENWKNSTKVVNLPYVKETMALLNEAVEGKLENGIEKATEYDENTLKEAYSLEKLWEVENVIMPESILSIPNDDFVYVSVINTYEKPGYISRYSKEGKLDKEKWIEGLNVPTGMAYYKGKIYAVDKSQVYIIDIKTAKIVKTVSSEAKTLNDITIGKDGIGYISDLTTGRIFRLKNDKIELWLHSDQFPTPNGVLVQGENLIVGSIGDELSKNLKPEQLGSLFKVNLQDKYVKVIAPSKRMGAIDGIVPFKKGMIVSDPINDKIFYVTNYKKEIITDTSGFGGGNADLGIDNKEQVLYVPYLFHNKIAAYKIVKK